MRVLFINHNIVWKGGFFRAYHWGRYLSKYGHSVSILTISKENKYKFEIIEKDGIKIIKSPDLFWGKLRTGWDPWDTIRRILYLITTKYDLVHCVDSRPNVIFPGLFMKYIKGSKLIIDWGDWWGRGGTISERSDSRIEKIFSPVETFFEEYFRKYADWNIVLTDVLKERALGLGLDSEKITTIRHGIDIDIVKPENKLNSRAALNISKNLKLIGYLGEIFPGDYKLLMDSFSLVLKKYPKTKLIFIGNNKIDFIKNNLFKDSIMKTGFVELDVMLKYIGCCDFMLLPLKDSIANRGRWPSKVCDYLSAGKPVIFTKVGDIANLLTKSNVGYMSEDTPESFSSSIIKGIEKNDTLEFEINARDFAEQKLSWNIHTKKLEEVYKKVFSVKS